MTLDKYNSSSLSTQGMCSSATRECILFVKCIFSFLNVSQKGNAVLGIPLGISDRQVLF